MQPKLLDVLIFKRISMYVEVLAFYYNDDPLVEMTGHILLVAVNTI